MTHVEAVKAMREAIKVKPREDYDMYHRRVVMDVVHILSRANA